MGADMGRSWLVGVGTLSAVFLVGCSTAHNDAGVCDFCTISNDCHSGLSCNLGACAPTCSTTKDCPTVSGYSLTCMAGSCYCTPTPLDLTGGLPDLSSSASCGGKCTTCTSSATCCSGYVCNSSSICVANTPASQESAMLVFFAGANNCAQPGTGVTIKLTNIDCCVVKTATLTASGMSPMSVDIAGMSACPEIYFVSPSTPGTYTVAVIDGSGNSIPAGTVTIPCP
jgi:hypothetical protein